MAASVDGFVEMFPEFGSRGAEQIGASLAAVELRVDPNWGSGRDEIVYLELADTLSAGVQGRNARKERGKSGNTRYRSKLDELQAIHALTGRVTG